MKSIGCLDPIQEYDLSPVAACKHLPSLNRCRTKGEASISCVLANAGLSEPAHVRVPLPDFYQHAALGRAFEIRPHLVPQHEILTSKVTCKLSSHNDKTPRLQPLRTLNSLI